MRVPFHQRLPRCLSRCLQKPVRQLLRGEHQRFQVNHLKHAGIEEEFHPCREFLGLVLLPEQEPDRRVRKDLKLGRDIHSLFGNIQEPTPWLHRRVNTPAHACGSCAWIFPSTAENASARARTAGDCTALTGTAGNEESGRRESALSSRRRVGKEVESMQPSLGAQDRRYRSIRRFLPAGDEKRPGIQPACVSVLLDLACPIRAVVFLKVNGGPDASRNRHEPGHFGR